MQFNGVTLQFGNHLLPFLLLSSQKLGKRIGFFRVFTVEEPEIFKFAAQGPVFEDETFVGWIEEYEFFVEFFLGLFDEVVIEDFNPFF